MSPAVTFGAVSAFRLVTAAPARLAEFYAAIGFEVGGTVPIAAEEMAVLGLEGGGGSRLALAVGANRVDLDFFDRRGRAYPDGASACDRIFQHLALVTDDAEAAWRCAFEAGASPISRSGAVTLPKSEGGVTAVKFRDPDGHPLEFLQFPPGTNSHWSGAGLMGIDHSAICVVDVEASRRFYNDHGLREGERSFNHGAAQVALDGLDDVEVDVAQMIPAERQPHVELLGYRRPPSRGGALLAANDVAATRVVWRASEEALVRDPDGHLHQLTRSDRSPADIASLR